MFQIAISNKSTVVTEDAFNQAIMAARVQISRDFSPAWGLTANLYVPRPGGIPMTGWELCVVDSKEQADSLGLTNSLRRRPMYLVYADTAEYWTVSFSHQILELLADPYCNTSIQVEPGKFSGLEVCDPVAGDDQSYLVHRVRMSNFILPNWFEAGSLGPWDHAEKLSAPLTLANGGYQSYWTDSGWTQEVSGESPRASRSYRHQMRVDRIG